MQFEKPASRGNPRPLFFQTACEMTCRCVIAGAVPAKKQLYSTKCLKYLMKLEVEMLGLGVQMPPFDV